MLEENHKDLYQWFLLHQECLLIGDDEYAQQGFLAFADILKQHMDFENNYIFTEVCKLKAPSRWDMHVYRKEHEKIEKLLLNVQEQLQAYLSSSGRMKRLHLLELLEKQSTLRHVLEHHEQREEQDIFLQLTDDVLKPWQQVEQGLERQYKGLKQQLKQLLA